MARRRRNRRLPVDNIPRRGIYLLPNMITSASLFLGFYSVIMSVQGQFNRAAWAIIGAMVCDALDGRVARLTRSTSKFGVQYDSLSDLSSFGVAPAVLVYLWALQYYGRWGWAAAFVYLVCGALRLARFNVQVEIAEKGKFTGLPIPLAAGVLATTVLLFYDWGDNLLLRRMISPVVVFGLAFLMISEIKYESFKEFEGARRHPFSTLVIGILLLVVLAVEPQTTMWTVSFAFTLSGPVQWLIKRVRKRDAAEDESLVEGSAPPDEPAGGESQEPRVKVFQGGKSRGDA